MKNYEKYADEIREYKGENFCADFVKPHILGECSCSQIDCGRCSMLQLLWLLDEYEEPKEPEVDWSKVEVDTPILVRNSDNKEWNKRYFVGYGDGYIYALSDGCTSWTAYNNSDVTEWQYAKLAETEGVERCLLK